MRLLNHLAMFRGPNKQSILNALIIHPPTHIESKFEYYGKSCPVCVHYLMINKEPYVPTECITTFNFIESSDGPGNMSRQIPNTIPKRHFNLQIQVEIS